VPDAEPEPFGGKSAPRDFGPRALGFLMVAFAISQFGWILKKSAAGENDTGRFTCPSSGWTIKAGICSKRNDCQPDA
jgi:hypothetical protein